MSRSDGGPRVALRPAEPSDLDAIRQMELHPRRLTAFRFRGTTPSPDVFAATLWSGTVVQMVMVAVESSAVIGTAAAFGPDYRNRHVQIGIMSSPLIPGAGVFAMEGTQLFLDYLFDTFDFLKVYAHVLEPNLAAFSTCVGPVAEVEGRLRGHEFMDGRRVDLVILALWRDRWHERPPSMRTRSGPSTVDPFAGRAVTIEEFTEHVCGWLDLPTPPKPDDRLADVGIDSIGMVQLLDLIEADGGDALELEAVAAIDTLAVAHHLYCARRRI